MRLLWLLSLASAGALRVRPSGVIPRRCAIGLLGAAATHPRAASAFFESAAQRAVIAAATAQPKLRSLLDTVEETGRRRVKMAVDPDDDAAVFRFGRAVLDPVTKDLAEAASSLRDPSQGREHAAAFEAAVADLYAACRARDAAAELQAATAAERALTRFLTLAGNEQFDVAPRRDINAYEGATWLTYPGFLFKAG
jgi:hypothetical protein